MTAAVLEQGYTYLRPSAVRVVDGAADLVLSTSGGRSSAGPVAHPVFFDGLLRHPEQAAAALLAVARVARTRFWTPPGMLAAILRAADPVVTSNGDRLRFESFSACCGVHARFDALPGSLDGRMLGTGTTNVDFNAPMRDALARVGGGQQLHLQVGEDVVVRTSEAEVVEEKVPLPERWLRGFAEVQLASAATEPAFEVGATQARRLFRDLPTSSGRAPVWVVPAGGGLRLTTRPTPEGVPLGGAHRLAPLGPLLRFARTLRAHTGGHDPRGAASVWELELEDARLVLTLSPAPNRGFSGEGRVLWDLASEGAARDADLVSALLAFEPRIDVDRLAVDAAISPDRVRRALGWLAAAGRVGHDVAEGAYFHRELPYDADRLVAQHPRLRDAAGLVADGAVRLDGDRALVHSGGSDHVVSRTVEGDRCTCPWWARHGGSRGPCKHVLAVQLATSATHGPTR